MAQLVKNPPAMRETWVRSLGWEDPPWGRERLLSLGWEDPLEKEKAKVLIQNLKSDKALGKQRCGPLTFSRKNISSLHMKALRLGQVGIFPRSYICLGQELNLPLAFVSP